MKQGKFFVCTVLLTFLAPSFTQAMNDTSLALQARPSAPASEEAVPRYVETAPVITSSTHHDQTIWHKAETATLSWWLPVDVTAVRTLLNTNPTSTPNKIYQDPISTITLTDLEQGESYFHLQLQTADGWGEVAHYRLAIDSKKPTSFEISQSPEANLANPVQELIVDVQDETSAVNRFLVKIDNQAPVAISRETASSTLTLPALSPGYHFIVIEAFDEAGNSVVESFSLTISAFDKPVFTEYPTEIGEGIIPVIRGVTKPNSVVKLLMKQGESESSLYLVRSDSEGTFTFIPKGALSRGVYELVAQTTDEDGAQSAISEVVRIAVQQPAYLRIGTLAVGVLSVVVPLLIFIGLLVAGVYYWLAHRRKSRQKVEVGSVQVLRILEREFALMQKTLLAEKTTMESLRKTRKLTKAEAQMIQTVDAALLSSKKKVEREIHSLSLKNK